MTACHLPNPLDTMFLVADQAAGALDLPPICIHIALHLGGQVEPGRLRAALDALAGRYPPLRGRLTHNPLGRLRWRICRPGEPAGRVPMRVIEVAGPQAAEQRLQDIYANSEVEPAEAGRPLALYVLRQPAGDVLLARIRHGLMDARGATFLLEDLDELYAAGADTAPPASDETDLFDHLIADVSLRERLRTAARALRRRPAAPVQQLGAQRLESARVGRLRYLRQTLDEQQLQAVQDAALTRCGFGRFGDYVRACGLLAALGALATPGPETVLSTYNLINHRKRRRRHPVCRNLTSAVPLGVPARLADDVVATADALRDQTLAAMNEQHSRRQFAALAVLMALPAPLLSGTLRRGWTGQKGASAGLLAPPTLPLGLMGPFSRPMPTFCGQPLENYYGLATARPLPGFTVDINTTGRAMNICVGYHDGLVSTGTMQRWLSGFVAALTGTGSADQRTARDAGL